MSEEITLPQLADAGAAPEDGGEPRDLHRLSAVPVDLTVQIGRTRMTVGETLELREGSVITLDRMADEPVDLLVNGILVARGEVVVIDEQFGLRLTKVLDPSRGVGAADADEDEGDPVAAGVGAGAGAPEAPGDGAAGP